MLLLVMFFSLSSSFFALKEVQVCFYNSFGEKVSLEDNYFYNTKSKVSGILSSTEFDYGTLVFSLQKDKYKSSLETKNPYIKMLSLESVFPNKLVINACERKEVFCMQNGENFCILDGEFKILDTRKNTENLIEINFYTNKSKQTFCEFFDLYFFSLDSGSFLVANNNVFLSIQNLYSILSSYQLNLENSLFSLDFYKGENNRVDIYLTTISPFGIKLFVENIFEKFDYKLSKLLSALATLNQEEKVKTTYGVLKIDKNCNLFWKENL